MDVTPKMALLCTHLTDLVSTLTSQLDTLRSKLGAEDILVLEPAVQNIVDRKKDKEALRRQWKLQIHEDRLAFEETEIEFLSDSVLDGSSKSRPHTNSKRKEKNVL